MGPKVPWIGHAKVPCRPYQHVDEVGYQGEHENLDYRCQLMSNGRPGMDVLSFTERNQATGLAPNSCLITWTAV